MKFTIKELNRIIDGIVSIRIKEKMDIQENGFNSFLDLESKRYDKKIEEIKKRTDKIGSYNKRLWTIVGIESFKSILIASLILFLLYKNGLI